MGMFNIFKRKENRQMAKAIEEFEKLCEKARHIKKTELPTIPDADLETVAVFWISGKFNEDWSDQYEIIASLPKPCQYVYSCNTVTGEINNGGFNQLFFNSAGQFAEISIEGFVELGSRELSNIMKQAVNRFEKNKPTLESYNDGTAENFSASYEEAIFDDLDHVFFRECGNVDYVNYIREHIECFGD